MVLVLMGFLLLVGDDFGNGLELAFNIEPIFLKE